MYQYCPFCEKKRRIARKKAEKIVFLAGVKYLYNPLKDDTVVWPCDRHADRFDAVMKKLMKKREKAADEYARLFLARVKRIKREIFKYAKQVAEEEKKKLKDGEGFILWVTDGFRKDGEFHDMYVVYIRRGGRVKRLYGELKPRTSYREGEEFSATHYIAQELDIILDTNKDIKWHGVIQGVKVSGEDLKRLINGIFLLTHEYPKDSLADLMRVSSGLGALMVLDAVIKSEKIPSLYALVDLDKISREIGEELKKKYGVNPVTGIDADTVLEYISRLDKEKKPDATLVESG